MGVSLDNLILHIFRMKSISVDEENLERFTGVQRRTIDRFKESYKSPYIIPIPKKADVTLEDAFNDSLEQLLEQSKGKKVCLLWSGGIDSTLVFCALVKSGIFFYVFMDNNSRNEYPMLYDKIINKEFNCDYRLFNERGLVDLLSLKDDKDILFITGEIGDQLTGSMVTMRFTYEQRNMMMQEVIEKDLFMKPYEKPEYKNKYKPILTGKMNGTESAIKFCEKSIYEFLGTNRKNTTLSEFLWALNFIFKYMLVLLRLHQVGLYFAGDRQNTYHFYNTVKFQQWSMSHYKENCAYIKETDYKMPFKEYIYKFLGDDHYMNSKLKEPSLSISFYHEGVKKVPTKAKIL